MSITETIFINSNLFLLPGSGKLPIFSAEKENNFLLIIFDHSVEKKSLKNYRSLKSTSKNDYRHFFPPKRQNV